MWVARQLNGAVGVFTAQLLYQYHLAPKVLSCTGVIDLTMTPGMFSGSGSPLDDAFFYSMVYWALEGRPDHMDVDHDEIPCDSLHDAASIKSIFEGGPVPLHIRN